MILGITMGDSSGVGPEILLKTAASGQLTVPYVVYGDLAVLARANRELNYGVELRAGATPAERTTRVQIKPVTPVFAVELAVIPVTDGIGVRIDAGRDKAVFISPVFIQITEFAGYRPAAVKALLYASHILLGMAVAPGPVRRRVE